MLCAWILCAVLGSQDPAVKQPEPAGVGGEALPPAMPIGEKEAKDAIKSLWGPKDRLPLAQKVERINAIAVMQHRALVKPLTDLVRNEPALTVRKAAAFALGRQPPPDSHNALVGLLKDDKVGAAPEVAASVVQALIQCAYVPADWAAVAPLFEKDFEANRSQLQQQILKLAAKHKEKQAVRLLLRHLDEPHPENPDAADNPPAEYWEKRYKCWKVWKDDAKEALFLITGQRFSTAKEAHAWLKVNGKKLGILEF